MYTFMFFLYDACTEGKRTGQTFPIVFLFKESNSALLMLGFWKFRERIVVVRQRLMWMIR